MGKKPTLISVAIDPDHPKGKMKPLGGGMADEWNARLSDLVINALPIAATRNKEKATEAALAVAYGTMDISPSDPIEGMLIAQLMAANEAALAMYRQGMGSNHRSISRRERNISNLLTRRRERWCC